MVACPYPDCSGSATGGAETCTACGRLLRWCACGTAGRLFARYCRRCGQPLAAAGEWRQAGGAAASRYLHRAIPFPPPIPEQAERQFYAGGSPRGECLYGHGHLFFATDTGVHIFRERDLTEVATLPNRSTQAMAISDEYLLLAGEAGIEAISLLSLLDDDGAPVEAGPRTLLRVPLAGGLPPLVVLSGSALACPATETDLHFLALAVDRAPATLARAGRGGIAIVQTPAGVVVCEESGEVWLADPAAGERKWQRKAADTLQLPAGCAAWENRIYLITAGGTLLVVSAESGRLLQTTVRANHAVGMACDASAVFLAGDQGLQRCRPIEGQSVTVSDQTLLTAPLLVAGSVFAGTNYGALLCCDSRGNQVRYQLREGLPDLPHCAPLLAGNHLYLTYASGDVLRYLILPGGEPA